MTREEAITKYIVPAIEKTWNDKRCKEILEALEQKPKTGHWIAEENEEMETIGYYCSECDLPMETENQTRFCPNCGCRMIEPQERIDNE